jgi:site-specific DNA recombinase
VNRKKRALIVVRLSRTTDATTSPERQRKACEEFCNRSDKQFEIVGVAEDLDVSAGKFAPWERPSLRPWLDRADEYDVIVFWRVDRFVRRTAHLQHMIEWSDQHGVQLASATESHFDLTTPGGRAMAQMVAIFAEMEIDAISERNSSAAQHNLKAGKWRGGVLPAGYRSEKVNGDWRLVTDDELGHVKPWFEKDDGGKPIGDPQIPADVPLAPVIREVVERVVAGDRLATIVRDLNDREIPTAKERACALTGREPKRLKWSISNLNRMLSSPTLIGHLVHRPVVMNENGNPKKVNGRKVYGPEQILFDGAQPVQRAALISEADFRDLQRVLALRKESTPVQKKSAETTLLLNVIHCNCGRPMYRLKGGPGRTPRYRCGSVQYGHPCGNGSVPMDQADTLVTENLMDLMGDLPHVEKKLTSWFDNTEEIRAIDARQESIALSIADFPVGSPAYESLRAQVRDLTARRETLVAQPEHVPGPQWVPSGQTFAEYWESLDPTRRNDYLRGHGVRLEVTKDPRRSSFDWNLFTGDIPEMVRQINPEAADRIKDGMSYRELKAAITGQPVEPMPWTG